MFIKILLITFLLIVPCFSKSLNFVTLEYPPYEYKEKDVIKGINIDVTKEALRRLNIDYKIRVFPWKRALVMVKNGKADGIIDIAYTKERSKFLHYTNTELNLITWNAFKKKDSNITIDKNFKNSHDLKVGITSGFEYGGIIKELLQSNSFKDIQVVNKYELNIDKLISNRFDIFFGIKANTLYLLKNMNHLDKVSIVKETNLDKEYVLNSYKTYLGFSKLRVDKEFVQTISDTLDEMKKDGTIKNINLKYLK